MSRRPSKTASARLTILRMSARHIGICCPKRPSPAQQLLAYGQLDLYSSVTGVGIGWEGGGGGGGAGRQSPIVVGVLGVISLLNHPHKGGQLGPITELVYGCESLHEVEAEGRQGVALCLLCKPKYVKVPVGFSILHIGKGKRCHLTFTNETIRA